MVTKLKNLSIFLFLFAIMHNVVHAQGEKEEGPELYVQAEAIWHASRDKAVANSYLGKVLYVEREVADGWAMFGQLYHDSEFYSGYVGVSKKLGNFTVALGAGPAHYLGRTRMAVSPWVYFEDEENRVEALVYAEYYRHDAERFYKASVQKTLDSNLIVGVYGESGAGIGPMFGYQFTEKLSVRVVVPTSVRPASGGVRGLLLFRYEF